MLESEIGAAARRECFGILDEILLPTLKLTFNNIRKDMKGRGMYAFPGSGTACAHLSNYLGPECHIVVTEYDDLDTSKALYPDNLLVLTNPTSGWQDAEFDFIIGGTPWNSLNREKEMINSAYAWVRSGGTFIVSGVKLSTCQCFPENFAFDRYTELLRAYEDLQGLTEKQKKITELIHETGFKAINTFSPLPSFLQQKHRKLPSIILEVISTSLNKYGLCSLIETQAILMELRNFANEPGTLISAPSGFVITASKI